MGVAERRTVKDNIRLAFAAVVQEHRVLDADMIAALTAIGEKHGERYKRRRWSGCRQASRPSVRSNLFRHAIIRPYGVPA